HYSASDSAGDVDIAATMVTRAGSPEWTGSVWIANSKRREVLASAVADVKGGAIAVFEESVVGDTIGNIDLYAAHVDDKGIVGWWLVPRKAVPVAASKHIERSPATVADGAGGVYVAYEVEYVSGHLRDADIFA